MLVIVAIQDLIAVRPEFATTVSASRDRFFLKKIIVFFTCIYSFIFEQIIDFVTKSMVN